MTHSAPSRRTAIRTAYVLLLTGCLAAGCGGPMRFPDEALTTSEVDGHTVRGYDVDGNGKTDYFQRLGPDGRVRSIGYGTTGNGQAAEWIDLDSIDPADCRHVVLILDGVPYDMARALREKGYLRHFGRPVRLISPYPSMTDLALADVFGTMRCLGYEARYFDHTTGRLAGGDSAYLAMVNEPWTKYLDYRADPVIDALGYLFPGWAFDREIEHFQKLFRKRTYQDVTAYFVATAGMGSRDGEEGLAKAVRAVDRLVSSLFWKTRGLVRVTLLADHGHTLEHCDRVDFRGWLSDRGWHMTAHPTKPRDVAPVEYGLVTYASFACPDRAGLAADLVEHEGVRFASYLENESVAVIGENGRALIDHSTRPGPDGSPVERYRYRTVEGDPLGLAPIAAGMDLDADGFATGRQWLAATATHTYPDAPPRLWRAYHGLATNVPDVVADLRPGYCAGSAGKAAWIPFMASTHGDLGRSSSTTFIMTTFHPAIPDGPHGDDGAPVLRSREVAPWLEKAVGRPWPPPGKPDGAK